ncbi:flagellar hook-length control protein FliK [uncultured Sphingomonas sp.]|uniref:flagellar hook-length control protein FliK n=1 Tax=uncultured Sphingomonas sp. TaxID=158754 RepID=UPI0025D32108|nr:flagellar hook-length control protein FliK [uncultured Sphingomonas sp.]
MNAKSNAAIPADDKAVHIVGRALTDGDADRDDTPATADGEAAAQPGNVLPILALPVTPDPTTPVAAADSPVTVTVASATVAVTTTRAAPSLAPQPVSASPSPGDATGLPSSDMALSLVDAVPVHPATNPVDARPVQSTDAAPPLVEATAASPINGIPVPPSMVVPLDASTTAKPTIDPTILQTLRQTTALPTTAAALSTPATTPAFRLVAIPMAAPTEPTAPPNLPSGPLTVTQPAQASATIGLLAAVMPRTVPPATPSAPDRAAATLDSQTVTATTPPLAMTPLPSGPLTVTQPGQASAMVGMLAGALRDRSTTKARDEDPIDGLATTKTSTFDPTALATGEMARPVTATGAADQKPLDMTQAHWPQGMIERIDRMREDAATADTRIQLSPDALGGIAVAIRHDAGGTHLHFTAEQAQTATMLADAHATLARLAEDKGMRLGDTAVATGGMAGSDMGQSMRDQRTPAQPLPVMPNRPRSPDTSLSDEAEAGSSATASPSTRIA